MKDKKIDLDQEATGLNAYFAGRDHNFQPAYPVKKRSVFDSWTDKQACPTCGTQVEAYRHRCRACNQLVKI